VLGAVLLAGLAFVTWMVSRPTPMTERDVVAGSEVTAGYYLRNATLFGTDSEGRVYYRLRAATVERQSDGGPLRFSDLTVEYDPSFDVHWRLSAAAGRTGATRDTLLLSDGVRLESAATDSTAGTTIDAETLTLDAAGSTATTSDRVALAHGRTRFEATGLTADLSSDRIDLHADVSARLVP
jgi:LPS export ABC transporter protein LptC